MSSEVSPRALHEIYLAPFLAAIKQAAPWSVMAAYNRLNGISCSENPTLLKEILKDNWGFDGLVVSDWIGTYSTAAANGGLDLEMPGPGRWMGAELVRMVESGEIPEAELDDKLRRLLRTIEHSPPQWRKRLKQRSPVKGNPVFSQKAYFINSQNVFGILLLYWPLVT